MVSETLERKLYNAASKGDVTTLVELREQDPYLIHEVSFSCSRNLLHIAAMHGQTAIVEELLKFSPMLARISDSHNSSPLHIAVEEGHVEISQKLLSVAPEACWWHDNHDMNPVHIAAMKGHVVIMEHLLQVSYLPAMERLHRKETVLHLCVKHGQLMALKVLVDKLGEDIVNAIDEDGETILHFAVRCNQFEILLYLVENNHIKSRTYNSTYKTELDILKESPPDTTTYMVVKRVLLRLSLPSISTVKPYITNSMMVVAVLIATMAFQSTVNPAGGVWQDDTSPHKAGEAVIAYTHPHMYKIMVRSNIVAFFSSIFTILCIAHGGPVAKHTCLLSIAFLAMCVSLASITVSYGASTLAINPNSNIKSLDLIALMLIIVSIVIAILTVFSLMVAIRSLSKIAKINIRNEEDLRINHLP